VMMIVALPRLRTAALLFLMSMSWSILRCIRFPHAQH
jgi:hypothetical protein